jgi:hypothetical protein
MNMFHFLKILFVIKNKFESLWNVQRKELLILLNSSRQYCRQIEKLPHVSLDFMLNAFLEFSGT